jgi:nicotinamidase-related amidase
MSKMLPIPDFFKAANAANWNYAPKYTKLRKDAHLWRIAHNILPSAAAAFQAHLLIIDAQKDFCFPEGTLYVAGQSGTGAIDDCARTAEFIYRNANILTDITTTVDTHFTYQIFTPSFLCYADGSPVLENTDVSHDDTASGRIEPNKEVAAWLCGGNYTWLKNYLNHYTSELERTGKYQLRVWPEHTVLQSSGHPLVGVIEEARMFHSSLRSVQSLCETKGGSPYTECYSVFGPEVRRTHDGMILDDGASRARILKKLLSAHILIIAGQASSHCVASSIMDLLEYILEQSPDLAKKVYILRDCTSPVVLPGIVDFTPKAEAAFAKFQTAGMHLVDSTTPIQEWPDVDVKLLLAA